MERRFVRQLAAAYMRMILALAAGSTIAAPTGDWKLDADGFGPFRIGMGFAQARALAPRIEATPTALRPSPNCDQLPLPGHPGVALMFVGGVLERVDIFKPGVHTARGIAPGDSVARFEQAYPGATPTPNAYDEREADFTVGPQRGRALRAATHEGKLTAIYAGNWTQVQYSEGCL